MIRSPHPVFKIENSDLCSLISNAPNDAVALERVKQFYQPKNRKWIREETRLRAKRGTVPVFVAADRGYGTVVDYLITQQHHDVNYQDKTGATALMCAIDTGHVNIALCLMEKHKANVHLKETNGCHPLGLASSKNQLSVVKAIVDQSASKAIPASEYDSALHQAVLGNSARELISFLLEKGADLSYRSKIKGETPLLAALRHGHAESLWAILKHLKQVPLTMDNFGEQILILEGMDSNLTDPQKRATAKPFLAAGMGLDINNIPESILTLFRRKRTEGQFLLLAQERQKNGTLKEVFINNLATLKAAVTSQNWVFESDLISQACVDPQVAN